MMDNRCFVVFIICWTVGTTRAMYGEMRGSLGISSNIVRFMRKGPWAFEITHISVQSGGSALQPPQGRFEGVVHGRGVADRRGELPRVSVSNNDNKHAPNLHTRCNRVRTTACE